jgi:hypothetical protein
VIWQKKAIACPHSAPILCIVFDAGLFVAGVVACLKKAE